MLWHSLYFAPVKQVLKSGILLHPQTPPPSQEVVDYAARGYEVFELVQEYYKTGNLYRENFPVQSGDGTYSFCGLIIV